MSYQLHKTEGIVLAHWPRGEHDRILRLYTKDFGGITLVAKGIRLEKSKLRGAVDLFCHTHVGFVVGKESNRLTYAEYLHTYPVLLKNWSRYRAADHIAGIVRRAVADGEPDSRIWLLVEGAFTFLNSDEYVASHELSYIYSFELRLLKCLGYLPSNLPQTACQLMDEKRFIEVSSYEVLQEVSLFLQPIRQYAALHMGPDAYIIGSKYESR